MARVLQILSFSIFVACLLLTGGCNKPVGDQDAVRTAIDKHLSTRSDLNMSAMDHEVKQVSIDRDQATAQVEFRLKQGGEPILVDYTLQRQNGEWVVVKDEPANGDSGHPMTQPPQAVTGNSPSGLPNFNDLLNQGNKPVPTGHPPTGGPPPGGTAGSN